MKTIFLSIMPILSAIAFMSSAQGVALYQDKEPEMPRTDRTPVQKIPNNIQRISGSATTTPTKHQINRSLPSRNPSNSDFDTPPT